MGRVRGPAVVWGTALLTPVLWFLARPLDERFATWQGGLGTLSKALGLLALALLAWAVILAARLRVVERLFDGLDRAYRYHHLVGGSAFVLALLHPTLLAARYAATSMERAAGLWVPTAGNWPLTLGQVAVYLAIPAMVATIYVPMRHIAFVWTQRLLGMLVVPAAAHVLLIRGDSRDFLPVRVYLLALLGAAFAAYLYHPVLSSLRAGRHSYLVESVRLLGSEVTELVLRPLGGIIHFLPGQFLFLRLADSALGGESHPFSIASAPGEGNVRLLVKKLGDYTAHLDEVQPGTVATLEGPYGTFSYRHWPNRRQIWIAGGIGIAPFLSMARNLGATPGYSVDLWYGHETPDDPLLAEVVSLGPRVRGLRVLPVCEETDARIDARRLATVSRIEDCEILICGPHEMMESLRTQFEELGVPAERVHYEDFAFR